jgi:methionyl-tRNA formyltransferase
MVERKPSCILLLSNDASLADAAEAYAHRLFNVLCAPRTERSQKVLDSSVSLALAQWPVDFVLNFLSPVIVPQAVLDAARIAAVNFHPAPPKWPGVGSASFALYEGDQTFGVTAHLMSAKVDSGPILRTLRFPILPEDDCQLLWSRALHHTLTLFYEVAFDLATSGQARLSGENWERPAITRKQFEQWMRILPGTPVEAIRRKVRALRHPRFPGPFMEVAGVRFTAQAAA